MVSTLTPQSIHRGLGLRLWIWTDVDDRSGSLAVWGGGVVIALLLIGNKIPVVKNDILKKIPIVRGYFIEQDNIPDSDKPF
jgi:hypothetical protein